MSWSMVVGHKSKISGSHVVRRLTSMDQSRVELVTKQWDTIADLSHPHRPPCHHISKFPNALRNNFPQNGHFHIADHGRGEPAQAESRLILLRLGDLKQRSDFIVSLVQQSRHSPVWKLLRVATVASWGWNVGAVMASFRVPHNYKWSRANNKTYKIVTFYIDFCQWASSALARR